MVSKRSSGGTDTWDYNKVRRVCAWVVTARATWTPTNRVRSDDSGSYASERLQSVFRENDTSSYIFRRRSLQRCEICSQQMCRRARSPPRGWKSPLRHRRHPGDLQGLRPCHRRLMARAAVRMTPSSIRKGSQVFRKPAQLDSGKQEELTQ